MKRVLPRSIRSYMKATSDNDHAVQERALARANTREGVVLTAALWRSFAAPEYDLRPHADRITAPCLSDLGIKRYRNPNAIRPVPPRPRYRVRDWRCCQRATCRSPRTPPDSWPSPRRSWPPPRADCNDPARPRYSQVTGGPCGEHTASSGRPHPASCGREPRTRPESRVFAAAAPASDGRTVSRLGPAAPSASIPAGTASCSSAERYCHMMECHSTVSAPAATRGRRRRRWHCGAATAPGPAGRCRSRRATDPAAPADRARHSSAASIRRRGWWRPAARCRSPDVHDLQGRGGRQLAPPRVVDGHRRVGRTPLAARIAVTVMVGAQVQPGTAADLEKPYRQIESVSKNQQTADQRGGPAHLVGLRRLVERGAQRSACSEAASAISGQAASRIPLPAGARIPAA